MQHRLIQVNEPKTYLKNECIHMKKGQRKMICILYGKMKTNKNGKVLFGGDVYDTLYRSEEHTLIAIEDSTVIAIEGENIDQLMSNQNGIINGILTSAVDYINEMKHKLHTKKTS